MVTVANGFEIAGCLKAAAAIEADLTQLINSLTEDQFHAPPRVGGWSVGFCIEHLVLTGQAFVPKWDAALKAAVKKELHGEERFRYRWWQRKILDCVENARLKHKSAPPFVPYSRGSIEETVRRFLGMHHELVARVASSRGLDLSRTKVQSPSVPWIRYGLAFSFDLTLAHERRHLYQAWRVRGQVVDKL